MNKRRFLVALSVLSLTALVAQPLHANPGDLKILKFEADWCSACKAMKPVFASVSKSYGTKVTFQTINVDKQASLSDSYKIKSLPTIVAVKNGKVVGRAVGSMSEAKLRKFIDRHQ